MTEREIRLRLRIDVLLDRCERLQTFLDISEAEQDRFSKLAASRLKNANRHKDRLSEMKRSRDMWKTRALSYSRGDWKVTA